MPSLGSLASTSWFLKCASMGWEQVFRGEADGVMMSGVFVLCVWVRFGLHCEANVPTSSGGIISEGVPAAALAHSLPTAGYDMTEGGKHSCLVVFSV